MARVMIHGCESRSNSSLEEEAEVVVVSVFLFFVPFQVLK
jgi:hypothetical protein